MPIHKFHTKIAFLFLSISFLVACQNQTVSNSANQPNSNIAANNSNSENQTNAEIPAPENIKFTSEGNVEIVGTFYASAKANSPAVLLLHQFGSSRASYEKFASDLQIKGFNILTIDGRGFGESVKTTDGKTVTAERTAEGVKGMKADVAQAFLYLAQQKNIDTARMGIVGASYGSSLAIIYAAEGLGVKATALVSPGINYFDNLPIEQTVKHYGDRPLLMVAAEDDKDSANAVRKLKADNPNEKYETKIYEKGGHGTALFAVGLQDLLEQFLTKNL